MPRNITSKSHWNESKQVKRNAWLTTLMPRVFITVIHTIVVTVADVDAGNAVAVVTGEQVAKAGATFTLAVLWGLVWPIAAVVVSVTVPRRWDAAVVRTPIRQPVHYCRFISTVDVYIVEFALVFDCGFWGITINNNIRIMMLEIQYLWTTMKNFEFEYYQVGVVPYKTCDEDKTTEWVWF